MHWIVIDGDERLTDVESVYPLMSSLNGFSWAIPWFETSEMAFVNGKGCIYF